MTDALVRLWPLFDLRLHVADLTLQMARDEQLAELAELVRDVGVHDPARMPFRVPWTDRPSPELEQGMLRYHWRLRSAFAPGDWGVDFVVTRNGRPLGAQGLYAKDFPIARTVETGSWLLRPEQGRGVGKAMRTAVLALAFDGLGALVARSGAMLDNPASVAVSRALGYHDDGTEELVVRGQRVVEQRLALTAVDWHARVRPLVRIEGLEACLELFGVGDG